MSKERQRVGDEETVRGAKRNVGGKAKAGFDSLDGEAVDTMGT